MKTGTALLLFGAVVALTSFVGLKVRAATELRVTVPEFPSVRISGGDLILTTNLLVQNSTRESFPIQGLDMFLESEGMRLGHFEALVAGTITIVPNGNTLVPVQLTIPLLEGGSILLAYFENKGGSFLLRGTVRSYGLAVPFSFSFRVENNSIYAK